MASGTPVDYPGPDAKPTGQMVPTVTAAVARTAQYYGDVTGNAKPGPDANSADYNLMAPLWKKVAAFATGTDGMRKVASNYLPKFDNEAEDDYKARLSTSPFTNVYDDIVGGLASKPFSREVAFEDPDEVDEVFEQLYENIDGRGNNLHVFGEQVFREGLENAIDWILVDFTRLPPLSPDGPPRSQAEEQRLGARPYWVRVAASNVKGVYSDMVRGNEVITHFRFYEPALVRDGFGEQVKERYRVFDRKPFRDADGNTDYKPATWTILEKHTDDKGKVTWEKFDEGAVTIGVIPAVPFRTGKRIGNGWAVQAPLSKLVDMQMDAFQQEGNIRNLELLTCYPMLTANGVAQPMQAPAVPGQPPAPVKVRVGPRAVLWAPPQGGGGSPGSWAYIEPGTESLKALAGRLDTTWKNMREIGMQPLAESNITVITSANVSVKAKSALQAWILMFKDTLEQAFVVTALWLGKTKEEAPGVDVYKDFGVDLQSGKDVDALLKANEQRVLSGETVRTELKRRNILMDSFVEEDEVQRLAEEAAAGLTEDEDGDPVTGQVDQGDGGEPADPGAFGSEDEIDDATLEALYGADAVAAAGGR